VLRKLVYVKKSTFAATIKLLEALNFFIIVYFAKEYINIVLPTHIAHIIFIEEAMKYAILQI